MPYGCRRLPDILFRHLWRRPLPLLDGKLRHFLDAVPNTPPNEALRLRCEGWDGWNDAVYHRRVRASFQRSEADQSEPGITPEKVRKSYGSNGRSWRV